MYKNSFHESANAVNVGRARYDFDIMIKYHLDFVVKKLSHQKNKPNLFSFPLCVVRFNLV